MSHLRLVPNTQPDAEEQRRMRVRAMPKRADGVVQCPKCGGRTMLTTVNGVEIKDGRKTRGTVIDKDVCADCWKRGVFSPMLPEIKPVKP
jgi:hypothetical protein